MRVAAALESSSGTVLIVERNYCMRHARKRLGSATLTEWNRPSLKIPGYSARGIFLAGEPGTESRAVDVATTENGDDRTFDSGIGQQHRQRGGPGGLHDQLAPKRDAFERVDDRGITDGTHLVDVTLDQRQVERPRVGRRQTIRDGVESRWNDRMSGGQALVHGRSLLGLDADDSDLRALLLHGGGHACDQAAPTDRHEQAANVRHRLEDLETHRALPGRDGRIIERMHEVNVPLALFGFESLLPVRHRRQHELRAGAADPLELAHGRVFSDDHDAWDPKRLRRVGQR